MTNFDDNAKQLYKLERARGIPLTGADIMMVIKEFPHLSLDINTSTSPVAWDEMVEYSSTFGVKQKRLGYLQTLVDIPVTFKVREIVESANIPTLGIVETVDLMRNTGYNGDLTVYHFTGKSLDTMKLLSKVVGASFAVEQGNGVEADVEGTTTPAIFTATMFGHVFTPDAEDYLLNARSLIGL